ncbi:MAG TPA: glutathione S-transferase family protein [Stellaceae bacterium]|nr:glutathione S-transferase family protein [Stellaceae bacterium]
MLTLYYSPGACSMASHIGLSESGAPYETKLVSLPKGEQKSETYLKVNPRGKVPALDAEGKIITENTAILHYLAHRFPEKNLAPRDPVEAARCISTCAWLSNTVHPSFTHIFRPERFASNEAHFPDIKETGKKAFWANLQEVDRLLAGKEWMMGSQFSVCDPYALVFYGWGTRIELPVKELKNYTAWKDRMLKRPAVMKVLQKEESILLKAA